MSLSLTQTYSAIGPNITSSFLGDGGVEPYTYGVLPDGAGGTIDASTGVYKAPAFLNSSPRYAYDIVEVTDANGDKARSSILIGDAIILFCDIIQKQMGLPDGRVYLWDQKIFQPKDYDLYIAVSIANCNPFSNRINYATITGNYYEQQSLSMYALLNIDVISRGPAALLRKEEVIMALNSTYSEQQQEANSFSIGRNSPKFTNLSNVDASAIPYRFRISCAIQYYSFKQTAINYLDDFSLPDTTVGD